jgi:hypothetical protein
MKFRYSVTFLIIIILLSLIIVTCTSTHRSRDKEREAVNLLGVADPGMWGSVELKINRECAQSSAARQIIESWLGSDLPFGSRPNIAASLHKTAMELANMKGCGNIFLSVPTSENPDTSAIIAILGEANSRRDTVLDVDNEFKLRISRHSYGWLLFIAWNGKVKFLEIDFAVSGY